MRENFVPLQGARIDGDDLVLPFDKDVVKDSPDISDGSHLDTDEEQSLYAYYDQHLGNGGGRTTGYDTATTDRDTDTTTFGRPDTMRGQGYDTSGPNIDGAMTRSEEQLRVGTERVEVGRARFRKYVVTEQQSVQVPVTREEPRIEREPITDANRGDALSGAAITEEEHEVVLHEERPVVTTEAVPVERVRLGTKTVTEQETVTGDIHKEQVEIDDDATATGSRDYTTVNRDR